MPDNWKEIAKEFVTVEPSAEKVRQAWMTHKEYRETCATNGTDIPVAEACCDEECFCSQNVPEVFNVSVGSCSEVPTICNYPNRCTREGILQEADRTAGENRSRDYGHPLINHQRIADIWNAQIGPKLKTTARIEPKDVALMMVGLKLARLANSPEHRDSLVDIVGYVKCWDMMDEAGS